MIIKNNLSATSEYHLEDYFPIKVTFNNYNEDNHFNYVRIDKDEYNALELSFRKTKERDLSSILLLCTNNYHFMPVKYIIPKNYSAGTISSSKNEKFIVESFEVNVYTDAAELRFSDTTISESVLCGKVLINFDREQKIVSIVLTDISDELRNHIISELEFGKGE